MSGILNRFRIEGLHNIHTIDIPIQDNRLILVGENGTGKSTVANFIYFFLTEQWSRMLDYTFKTISVTIDGEEYKATQREIISFIRYDKMGSEELRLPFSLRRRIVKEAGSPTKLLENAPYFSKKYRIPVGIIKQYADNLRENPFFRLEKLYSFTANNKILYLPTYRRIEQNFKDIFPNLEERNFRETREYRRRRVKKDYIELVEFGMDDVEKIVAQKMDEIKEKVREELDNLTGAYLRDMIQAVYETVTVDELGELDEDGIKTIFNRIPEKTLSKQDKDKLRDIIGKIKETGTISDHNKIVAHFLVKLIEMRNKQQADEQDIRDFVKVCNDYLKGKRLEYDDVKFNLSITYDKQTEHSPELTMKQLSSGEKQLISIFAHTYLANRSDFFVIIDEPELSLSVLWQQRFLPDLLKKCNGLIAVTHSPFIFEDKNLRTYVHSIEEFVEPFDYNPELEIEDEVPF